MPGTSAQRAARQDVVAQAAASDEPRTGGITTADTPTPPPVRVLKG
jgi:hypothetical protein